MNRVRSVREFDLCSVEERLKGIEGILDRSQEVRARGVATRGELDSPGVLRGKTAILPSHWFSYFCWKSKKERGRCDRLDWIQNNQSHLFASPLDFGIKLAVVEATSLWVGSYWLRGEPVFAAVVEAASGEDDSCVRFIELIEKCVEAKGEGLERTVKGLLPFRLVFRCSIEELKALARRLDEEGLELPEDKHFFSTGASLRNTLGGKDPSKVSIEHSQVSPRRCAGIADYALGVVFDLSVELGLSLHCPLGVWSYEVRFLDSDAIAECGVDRFETVLFDQPEARTVGVLSTSFGDIQLNQIYADGRYRLELESKYPLDELPKELADWGVEFDLK